MTKTKGCYEHNTDEQIRTECHRNGIASITQHATQPKQIHEATKAKSPSGKKEKAHQLFGVKAAGSEPPTTKIIHIHFDSIP